MIEELKLINRKTGDTSIISNMMDIEYDENGQFLRCSNDEGREQNLLKMIFTGKLINGYGTGIKKMLGTKNLTFMRTNLLINILGGLNKMKEAQLRFMNSNPTYNKKNIISTVLNIFTNKTNNTSVNCSLKVIDLDTEIKGKNTVSDINVNV